MYMTPGLIVIIIITSASFLTLLLSPIMSCAIEFSRHIEKSSCCGSNMELTHINDMKKELLEAQSMHKIEIGNIKNILENQK